MAWVCDMENVLVIDFGGQYSQLIARRIRELRVYSELIPYDTDIEKIKEKKPGGLIFSGSPYSILSRSKKPPMIDKEILYLGVPIIGICYGMQLIAYLLGGKITSSGSNEYGKTRINFDTGSLIFKGLKSVETCLMSHKDCVLKVPPNIKVIASTHNLPIAGIEESERKIYGIQFHPEVKHTPSGMDILKNFLFSICKCSPTWTMVSIIGSQVEKIKNIVKNGRVIGALSGGVDSSVAAILVNKAVGDKLTCIFVDHGLLRKGEDQQVKETFRKNFKINLVHVKAKDRFLKKLVGVADPEEKRKIIGNEFIRIFENKRCRFLSSGHFVSRCNRKWH